MICMETIAKIRRLYHKESLSIRAIALKLNINRRTVKKHIEQTVMPIYQKPAKRYPMLGPFLTQLDQRLIQAQMQPKIKRLTACRHYEWLKSCGYQAVTVQCQHIFGNLLTKVHHHQSPLFLSISP